MSIQVVGFKLLFPRFSTIYPKCFVLPIVFLFLTNFTVFLDFIALNLNVRMLYICMTGVRLNGEVKKDGI